MNDGEFTFKNYRVNGSAVTFYYSTTSPTGQTYQLTEKLIFPHPIDTANPLVTGLLDALLIAIGTSYYKIFLPKQFKYDLAMSSGQAAFWNNVYLNGLAEFLYTNQLPPEKLAKFTVSEQTQISAPVKAPNLTGALLAIGGGKDSIVTGELLKKIGLPFNGYTMASGEHLGQAATVAKDMDVELLGVQRHIDPQFFELNKLKYSYNGHVPVSLIIGLCGLLLAALTNKKYLVVGNEANASVPNTTWNNLVVNHQWSKSFELEQDLQKYVHQYVSPDLWYFSAVRPLSSVAIAKLFAVHPIYLNDFTSCNRVFLQDPASRPNGHWCGQCAKCLSSFIILSPWLAPDKLTELFGKNMLNDTAQEKQFLELMGRQGHKPLDCVGTSEELILSLNLAVKNGKFSNEFLLQIAKDHGLIKDTDWDSQLQKFLTPSTENAFPPELAAKLSNAVQEGLKA